MGCYHPPRERHANFSRLVRWLTPATDFGGLRELRRSLGRTNVAGCLGVGCPCCRALAYEAGEQWPRHRAPKSVTLRP
eukprot:scaffold22182_cov74-Phaeocystis_antarctica.AAC.2